MTIIMLLSVLSVSAVIENGASHDYSEASIESLRDSAWPMRGHDLGHTGQSQYDTSDTNGTELWEFVTNNYICSSPAVDSDGTIYIGSVDNRLYAINPNGTKKWDFLSGGAIYSSPAVDSDGMIYFGSYDHKLYALYPNGTKSWEFSTGGSLFSSPAIGTDGTIYIGSWDNSLYAIFPNGTKAWEFSTGSDIHSSPAIGSDGTIYVGSVDKKLYAVNPNGTKKWEFATDGSVSSSPAIGSDGTIYFGSYDKKLYAVNPNGTKKWEFMTGSYIESSAAIGSDGTIYFGSFDSKLYAVDTNGNKSWEFLTGGSVRSSPAISPDGTIYVGSYDCKLYAIGFNNPPTCTITSPTGASTYFASWEWIQLKGTAYDDVAISNITWSNSLGGSGTAYMSPQWGGDNVTWQSSGNVMLYAGDNIITVTAYDSAGNSATDTLTATYDQTAPNCTITSPTASAKYSTNSGTIDLGGSASDNVGVAAVTWMNMATGSSGTATGNTSWSAAGISLNAGMNLIYVNVTDDVGNKGSDAIWVMCDTDSPNVAITDPTSNSTMITDWHMISLKGNATDNNKVTLVEWSNSLGGSGTAYMSPQWGGDNVTWQSRGNVMLYAGDNIITVTAYDSAGNSATCILVVTYIGP